METLCRIADEDKRIDALLNERQEAREVRHLIIAASEQDDMVGERQQGLLRRIRIRRLGIVVVGHAVELAYELQPVLNALERLQHLHHGAWRAAREKCTGRGGQRIGHIMLALDAQLLHCAQRVALPLPADGQAAFMHESALSELLRGAEIADAAQRALLHAARARIVVVQHEEILCRLLGKELLLHRLIDVHGLVTDDVVWCHVEHCRYMRVEMMRRLHLEAGDLRHDAAIRPDFQCRLGKGYADVTRKANLLLRITRLHEQA